jgi:hypothetical protein
VHLIDHPRAIDVEAHAVVDREIELIRSGVEVDRARPAHGEVISRQTLARNPGTPVKTHGAIVAHDDRRAPQSLIVRILAFPQDKPGRRRSSISVKTSGRRLRSSMWSEWHVLFIGSIISIVLWPIPGFMRDLTSFTIAWAALNGTVWSIFALSFSVLSSSTTDDTRGRVMSFAFLPVNVGSIIGPAIGSVITQTSLFNVFPVAAVFTAIGVGGLVLAYRQQVISEPITDPAPAS